MSQKRTWCDYDVQKSSKEGTEFFIRSNGSWQGNGVAHMYAQSLTKEKEKKLFGM